MPRRMTELRHLASLAVLTVVAAAMAGAASYAGGVWEQGLDPLGLTPRHLSAHAAPPGPEFAEAIARQQAPAVAGRPAACQTFDVAKSRTDRKRMKLHLAGRWAALTLVPAAILPLSAMGADLGRAPAAIVEQAAPERTDIRALDTLVEGQVIQLATGERLVLGYLRSCWQENVTGGTVTIGRERSLVKGGQVSRRRVECAGGRMNLTADQAARTSTSAVKRGPKAQNTPR